MQFSQIIQGILLICIFFLNTSGLKAEERVYSDLPDSLRLKIRLYSYILIHPSEIDSYLNILSDKVPFAIDGREIDRSQLTEIIGKVKRTGYPIPVIINNRPNIDVHDSAEIIFISPDVYDQYQLQPNKNDSIKFPGFSVRELLLVESKDSLPDAENFIQLWLARGKMPNFIEIRNLNIPRLIKLIKELNDYKKIFGVVCSDEGLLPCVLLKDNPTVQISGYFCFPTVRAVSLKPYKAGYQFSPDIIHHSPSNEKNMKIFRGIRLDPDFAMSEHFRFVKGVKNSCRPDSKEFITQNVLFTHDKQFGAVAYFKNAFVDAGIESKTILNSAFSISVWIKPVELGGNNSILGKGTNFVLKIHEGKLTFTMAGIKDYISESSPIEAGKWTHVAVVYSALEKNLKFYLNGAMTDQINLIADYTGSDYSLLIGSNLWEEFFVGYIGDVKIWERELNEQEIKADFQTPVADKSFWAVKIIGFCLLLISVSVLLFIRKKKKGAIDKKQNNSCDEHEMPVNLKTTANSNGKIVCFGNLKIICSNEIDISHKLSPKLKQLFVLIMLHSGAGKKGISSKKLSEILWPGMNAANAKNTRGTSIQNLRQILSGCEGLTITFKDKMWYLELAENVSCDYYEAENLISKAENCTDLQQLKLLAQKLVQALKTGKFISNMEVTWMDNFHDAFSSRIIELCLGMMNQFENREAALQLELAAIVSMYDELNETALQTKVRILSTQGKHSLAKSAYENYTKLYAELYNTNYPVEFLELIKS